MGQLLWRPVFRDLHAERDDAAGSGGDGGSGASGGGGDTIVVNGRRLPRPTEGEPIPAANQGGITTRDGSIYTVWTSPTDHHMVFRYPQDERARGQPPRP
jgi:hypothetical protein